MNTRRWILFGSMAALALASGCDGKKKGAAIAMSAAAATAASASSASQLDRSSAPGQASSSLRALPSADPEPAEPSAAAVAAPSASALASAARVARTVPSAKPVGSASGSASGSAPSPDKGLGLKPAPSSSALASAPPASGQAPGPAAPGSADAVADKVDAIYLPIQRFRARFEQRYTAKIAGTIKNSDGVCYVKRPGKISFSYHKPNNNRVVSDGTTLKIYEAENQQMFIRAVASTEYPGALSFIMGKGLRSSFTFEFNDLAKWEGGPVIIGTPRVPNPGYEKVMFYIDSELLAKGDPACVRRVLVIDAQGNRNRFDFIHVEQPDEIPGSEFEFEPPPGTNVIR